MFLVNSRFSLVSAALSPRRQAPSRSGPPSPEVTGHFAEFLNPRFTRSPWYSLPNHLSRFGVRAARTSLEDFLGSIGSPCFPHSRSLSGLRICATRICLCRSLHPLDVDYHRHAEAAASCVSPSLDYYCLGSRAPLGPSPEGLVNKLQALLVSSGAVLRRFRNINRMSIDYACRPRLRSRLTQGRLA